ncbi:multidrug ABC transporter [Bacillus cereus]|uniref:ABC transporter ATP-binding protein n=1 Tax=Bacillus sp. AFS023182 TaxID=2033492 RepID=UPI000BF8A654|nr:ABC transporter ATP-binding protein [Bacillus sp. AFS023182]PFE04350.1 multidrug ABC transporter [Bacillus sp. AFS023182]PGY05074.1 multidrug ABC transporter [Bacillus cereus]
MRNILYFTKQLYSFTGNILIINLLGMVSVSLVEGIGILLLIPMLSISGIANMNEKASPLSGALGFLSDFPATLGLPLVLGIYIVLVVGQAVLQSNITIRNAKIQIRFINHLRLETYRGLLQANWSFFVKKRKSDLINSLTTELGRVSAGTNLFLQLLTSLIFTFIQIGLAFWLSADITLFVLCCGVVLAFFSRRFIKKSKRLGGRTSENSKAYLAGITDHFNGIKDIKSNLLEQSRYMWLRNWTEDVEREQLAYIKVRNNSQLFYKIASAISIALLILLSVKLFRTQTEQLLLIILIFSRLWPRFSGIQSNMEQIAANLPAFKALLDLQEECKKSIELQDVEQNYNFLKPIQIEQSIECRNISFRYNKQDSIYALENINLSIPSNCMTAISGRSGAGKSTLIDIVMGLLQPESGQLLIDNKPLTSKNLLSLRKSISYVSQDPFLFNASIRDNLRMVEPDASEEQIWEALDFSASAEFVSRLPQGLDTLIGDRGVKLSGGERQRLVLARAILRKPSILVLDEATSALDAENEAKIQEALERLKGSMTIIVIAHRLSTIRKADQVIVMDQGKIIQSGGFTQLAKDKSGLFSSLLGQQAKINI